MTPDEPIQQIWENYRANLYRFIRKRVANDVIAEDILQTTILKIIENIHSIRDQQKLKSWIYQITRNVIVDYYRVNGEVGPLPAEILQPEADDIDRTRDELERCLKPMIDSLPEKYRRAVILSDLDGLSQQDLADRENLSVSGAKSRVQRGRALLKERFEQCCQFEYDHRGSPTDLSPKKSPCNSC